MQAVLVASDLSAYAIEKKLQPEAVQRRDHVVVRPRRWDRYVAGAMTPRDDRPLSAVAMADAHWPGTAMWFRSPLWRALDDRPLHASEAETLLRNLPSLQDTLLARERGALKRRPVDHGMCEQIRTHGTFEALAATIIWAREAEVIASPELRRACPEFCV
jgi:hypothetical protein